MPARTAVTAFGSLKPTIIVFQAGFIYSPVVMISRISLMGMVTGPMRISNMKRAKNRHSKTSNKVTFNGIFMIIAG